MKPWILTLVAALCMAVESAPASTPTWVSLGVGPGSVAGSSQSWIAARFAVQWSKGSNLWTIGTAGCSEFDIFGSMQPNEYARDYGLLYGKRWSGAMGYVSASAGLGLVAGMRRGKYTGNSGEWFFGTSYYEEKPFVTVGAPVDVQFVLAPIKFFGLGLDFFGNVNPKRSFGGGMLSLFVGQLR
jgi:hypothetical protein